MSVLCRLFNIIGGGGGGVRGACSYTQGQYEGKVREYFYYVDHHGQLFLDDSRMKNFTSCFKDPKFLAFFFRNLRHRGDSSHTPSESSHTPLDSDSKSDSKKVIRYANFGYISLCGIERNYVRSDDVAIVMTSLSGERLFYNHTSLSVPFLPHKLYLHENGRMYHPGPAYFLNNNISGTALSLVRSQLCDSLSTKLVSAVGVGKYDGIKWNEEIIYFDNDDVAELVNKFSLKN